MAWCEYSGYFLRRYSSEPNNYDSLDRAQADCLERDDCGGITRVNNGSYTLRKGSEPQEAEREGRISWVTCATGRWSRGNSTQVSLTFLIFIA